MLQYLIDVNLPYRFKLWHSPEYIHQYDIGDTWSDNQIWEYAKRKNLTIITKDADFSAKIILAKPPPSVIHMRIGNMKFQELHDFLNRVWPEVLKMSLDYKLVTVFKDHIEGVH
jgi:predicted nuclease of predicted toxin-antitoxin system